MHIIEEVKRHPVRAWKTLCQLCCYMVLGMSMGVIGPSLLDLRQQVQATLTAIAFIMSARAGGHVVGSLFMGFIYSRINYQVASSILMTIAAAVTFTIPYMRTIWSLLAVFSVNGAVMGFMEAGSNVFLLQLWGKETSPFMQVLHSMYGIGALIGPLICSPFLLVKAEDEVEDPKSDEKEIFHSELIDLRVPFSIVAAILLFNAVFSGILWRLHPVTDAHPSRHVNNNPEPDTRMRSASGHGSFVVTRELAASEEAVIKSKNSYFIYWKAVVIAFAMLFMHAFYGVEQGLGSFLLTFAVKSNLHLSKRTGAQITTMSWAAFSFSRFPKIFLINMIGNASSIYAGLALMLVANCILLPFADRNEWAIWTGVAIMGIGSSSIWACMFGYLDMYFPVTSFIGSMIFVSAVLGEFVFPVIISYHIETYPLILLWVLFGCTVGMLVFFFFITLICRNRLKVTSSD